MDETLNRGYDFPECEPPLVKDASDIKQMYQQALEIDADMTALEDAYAQVLLRPDACKMSSAAVVSTEQTFFPFFNTAVFDNRGDMADTVNGVIQVQESGWYMVGEWGTLNGPDEGNPRVRFLRNGSPASNFSDSSFRVTATEAACSSELVLILSAGDTLAVEVRHGAVVGTNRTFTWNIFAFQLVRT